MPIEERQHPLAPGSGETVGEPDRAPAGAPDERTPRGETAGAQTLRRGLAVLRLLTRAGPSGLRMGEIGRRLGLNKSTAIRLTRTLVEEGFVRHDPATGTYRPGSETFAAGLGDAPGYTLLQVAAPVMRALALESGDTALLTVPHGIESICVSRADGDFPIRNQLVKAGDCLPLGVSAGGCAILGALPDADVDAILARNAVQRRLHYPRCTDAAIRALIDETRHQGWCLNPGLVLESSWAIAVPVHDAGRRPVAALSLAAMDQRLGPARRAALADRLVQAGAALTDALAEAALEAG